jgi:hypothetical protein
MSDEQASFENLDPIPLQRETDLIENFNILNIFNFPLNLGRLLEEELPFIQRNPFRPRAPETELSRISSDVENVHDSKVNKNIKKLSEEILKFPPNPRVDIMKTIFNEIIMTDEVRSQLTHMYYRKDQFLNYGESSYRKFMDCIISYTLSQPEDRKKEIFGILNNEISESIGLCFQGNISRLVNVLSGFIEVVLEYEPTIQEVFAEISKIEDKNIKFEKAIKAFDDFSVDPTQWGSWLEALELE